MASGTSAVLGNGFLSARLARVFDLVLRRRVGMLDWALVILVVSAGQFSGANAIAWAPYWGLLALGLSFMALWFWVFPRLSVDRALDLEAAMSVGTALGASVLVALTGGPESPYVLFFSLLVVYVASFIERVRLCIVLVLLTAVCALLPLAYEPMNSYESGFALTMLVAVPCWLAIAALVLLKRQTAINAELRARWLAYVDPLTEAANRRAIEQYADDLRAEGREFALVFIEAGGIGDINRSLGHFAGDDALRRVTAAMREASSETDQVGRLVGADFVVLMPDANLAQAQGWRRRFHERLVLATAMSEDGLAVSARAGCAQSDSATGSLGNLLARASEDLVELTGRPPSRVASLDPEVRTARLRAHIERHGDGDGRLSLASVEAPTSLLIAIPVGLALAILVAVTGGASSSLFSLVSLLVAYVATFGSRREAAVTTTIALLAGLVAVLVNAPLSNVDQMRALTVFATVATLAFTLHRNNLRLTTAERRTAERSLADPLTGLANRTAFELDLLTILAQARGPQVSRLERLEGDPAVITLDLSDFRSARARLGHSEAELLLVEVAEALRDAVGADGKVYLIDGSEYATIIRAHHIQHVEVVCARCCEQVEAIDCNQRYADRGVTVGCTAGGAIWDGRMSAADLAAAAISQQASARSVTAFGPLAG